MTPGTVARQAPLSMGFFRQEYWGGLPFPSPGDLPNPRIELMSPSLQMDCMEVDNDRMVFKAMRLFNKGTEWTSVD